MTVATLEERWQAFAKLCNHSNALSALSRSAYYAGMFEMFGFFAVELQGLSDREFTAASKVIEAEFLEYARGLMGR